MCPRPRIKPILTIQDKILEAISCIALILIWGVIVDSYPTLPDRIPTHYNALGQIDGWGSKSEILFPPILASILFVVLTIINLFPHTFNYYRKITPKNALRQYTFATRSVRYVKLSVVLIFGTVVWVLLTNANGTSDAHFARYLPWLSIVLVLITLVYVIYNAFRTSRR